MGTLEVCSEGLQALAARCSADAEGLAGHVSTGVAGPPFQATATAVGGAYAAISATATVLASRVHATGDKVAHAATQFRSNDDVSARQLSALHVESSRA